MSEPVIYKVEAETPSFWREIGNGMLEELDVERFTRSKEWVHKFIGPLTRMKLVPATSELPKGVSNNHHQTRLQSDINVALAAHRDALEDIVDDILVVLSSYETRDRYVTREELDRNEGLLRSAIARLRYTSDT